MEKIEGFLGAATRLRGHDQAKQALGVIRDNAWSPMETVIAAMAMLTARDAVMDKVAGLDAGADDYITKPFAIEELLARIRVALKRREASAGEAQEVPSRTAVVKGVSLDVDRREVTVNGESVELTNREFEVLRLLMRSGEVKTSSVGMLGKKATPSCVRAAPPSQMWALVRPTVRSVPFEAA